MAVVHAVSAFPRRGVVRAGRTIAALGAVHLAGTGLMNLEYVPDWFTGELWLPANGLTDLTPAQGAFWLVVGSFAVPLTLLGLVVAWLGRRGIAPPVFVAWGIGMWGTAGALVFEPSPFLLVWIPAVMLWRDASAAGVVGPEDDEQHP